jgi:Reverse transcriptase (RNA-dependent DNA polymerase)/GAG-pre-integrase domain
MFVLYSTVSYVNDIMDCTSPIEPGELMIPLYAVYYMYCLYSGINPYTLRDLQLRLSVQHLCSLLMTILILLVSPISDHKYVPKRQRAPPSVSKYKYISRGLWYISSKVLSKLIPLSNVRVFNNFVTDASKRALLTRRKGRTNRPYKMRECKFSTRRRGMLLLSLLASRDKIKVHAVKRTPSTTIPVQNNIRYHQGTPLDDVTLPTLDESIATMALRDYMLYGTPLEYHSSVAEGGIKPDRHATTFDTDSVQIRIDNCSTRTVSFNHKDFDPSSVRAVNQRIEGISGQSSKISHTGTIMWRVLDDAGAVQTLRIPNSLLVPEAKVRLLSPQHLAQELQANSIIQDGTICTTYADRIVLQWNNHKYTKTIPLSSSNIGIFWTAPGYKRYKAYCTTTINQFKEPIETVSFETRVLADQEEQETPPSQREEQEVHQGIHQADFDLNGVTTTNFEPDEWTDQGQDASSELLRLHNRLGHISMLRLQNMAKQGHLPRRLATCRIPMCQSCVYGKLTKKQWRTTATIKPISVASRPGECVSVDQLETPIPALIGQLKGIPTRKRFHVATVFVDHLSGLSFVHLQQSTGAEETLAAKHAFELYANSYGISVSHYHADNGRFSDKMWRNDILDKGQRLTFSGVGAHHQNGRAEKRIRDLQELARASLMHASKRWAVAINSHLWGYALRHANDCINSTPFPGNDMPPIELFSESKVSSNVRDHHPFGCPAYILDSNLQGNKKIPKWSPRARLGIYIGRSQQHARSVGLILSTTTGLVSPQFHVRYDDSFETVQNTDTVSHWQDKCGFRESTPTIQREDETRGIEDPVEAENVHEDIQIGQQEDSDPNHELENDQVDEASTINQEQQDMESDDHSSVSGVNLPPHQGPTVTRSGRQTRVPTRLRDYYVYNSVIMEDTDFTSYAASSDPDIMYLNEAMRQPDRDKFLKAMEDEVRAHTENGNWMLVPRKSVPSNQPVLPAVWAMRRKRDIASQEVIKWKARLNVHGGKQIRGVNYWETYAPVATWASIRLIMTMAALNKWKTKQLDFVLAFPQAPVETDIYMEVPTGFKLISKQDKVLKLVNNLYGQKQAGRVWNTFLNDGLKKIGFTQSNNEPCLFWRNSTLIIIYTDDTIVTGPLESEINQAIIDIGEQFKITHQQRVKDFLGVKVERDEETGIVNFTQPHLIDSILKDVGLCENSNFRLTPALSTKILHSHPDSPPHAESWSYRSVVGKLNYLEKSTRPDIAYAVHQCARFSANPKIEHTQAIKMIARYLKGTKEKGIQCTPNNDSFKCYTDADFAGNWNADYAENDQSTARSRSGYVVKYSNCPIIWASKLQTEIALSSTESEYISLYQSLREVLPLMRLVEELSEAGFHVHTGTPEVRCKVFEDNVGAMTMAQTPRMRPRTKHLNIKYHHFRDAVEQGKVTIHQIGTLDQQADIFTKPLSVELFVKFRKLIMGW